MGNSALVINNFSTKGPVTSATIDGQDMTFYDLKEIDAKGNELKFSQFRGKVVYGVNVASSCGTTGDGYALIRQIETTGVEVVLFPCNQFLGQESGSNKEIKEFCVKQGATFAHVLEKANVNGTNARLTYKFLKGAKVMGTVPWNFQGGFVVNKEGQVFKVRNRATLVQDLIKLK